MMIPFDFAIEIVDSIAKHASVPDPLTPIVREEFVRGTGHNDDDITQNQFISGIRNAIRAGSLGLWLDHNEAHELTSQALIIIETYVGVPDDPEWRPYHYDGTSVEEGLAGFDAWLLNNYLDKPARAQLRLVEVSTGADYYMSIIHPNERIDDLIERLSAVDISARRQTTLQAPAPEIQAFDEFEDPSEFAVHYLQAHHGYDKPGSFDRYLRWIDDEHAVVIDLVASNNVDWDSEDANEPAFVAPGAFEVGLLRRDIQDFEAMLSGQTIHHDYMYKPTIGDRIAPFLNRPADIPNTEREIIGYLDTWIPQLERLAILAYIEGHLGARTAEFFGPKAELNRALSGRATNEDAATLNAQFDTFAEWAAQHPHGVQRRLA